MDPVRQEGYKFRQDVCIPCYQTNRNACLRPSAFMDMAQEIAYWAAQALGFGYDNLHEHHIAWVLSRMHIRFNKTLQWHQHATLYTWHKGANGLFYLRDFELLGPDGTPAVQATSSWVVIDERTRHFVRPEELPGTLVLDYEVADAIVEPAPKVMVPRDARSEPGMTGEGPAMTREEPGMTGEEPGMTHVVADSDLDILGHTNNVRYVVWALDCLPPEVAQQPMKDLSISFNRETTLGESVQLSRWQEENSWYVEGCVDGKSCFVVKMEF